MFGLYFLFVLMPSLTALNDSDYHRMPPLFHLDPFEECFDEPGSKFCYGEFVLVSDEPSELLNMTQKFSEDFRHYNHTLLRYGYCMKETCNEFYNVSASDVDLRLSFEACANKTIYDKYKLKTRLTEELDCSERDRDLPIDNLDIFVGVVCIVIIMANIIGSICDRYLEKGKERGALQYLYCFSIFRNWKAFVAPVGEGRDRRLKALRGINGIRAISMCFVVITHTLITILVFVVNTELIEDLFHDKIVHIFMSGPLIMQTFFLVSSFLLVYTWLLELETRQLSWSMLPRYIINRWLRLTPAYALMIGLTGTWFARLVSGGPAWEKAIHLEARDCRRYWWTHVLYINNYVERTNCMAQTWYMASDTQLYIFAVIIFLSCRTNKIRKVVLSVFFVVGIIVPMAHIYYNHNLNGIVIPTVEISQLLICNLFIGVFTLTVIRKNTIYRTALKIFVGDPTFEEIFSRGHTNLTGCIIGMAMGYIIYNWQKAGGDPKKFQKYRYLYWCLPALFVLVCSTGFIFYADGPPLPRYVHMLYAGLQKPVFGLIIATVVAGLVIQFEDLYRPLLEWRPFAYIGRLSYSAYLVHLPFIRTDIASIMTLQKISIIGIVPKSLTMSVGVFIAAFFFCLIVEMPFSILARELLKKPRTKEQIKKKETVNETEKTENQNPKDSSEIKTEDGTVVIKIGTRM